MVHFVLLNLVARQTIGVVNTSEVLGVHIWYEYQEKHFNQKGRSPTITAGIAGAAFVEMEGSKLH